MTIGIICLSSFATSFFSYALPTLIFSSEGMVDTFGPMPGKGESIEGTGELARETGELLPSAGGIIVGEYSIFECLCIAR